MSSDFNMAKKKKTALKPVARGFATTSQPKKKVEEPEPEAEEAGSADKAADQDEGAARTVDRPVAGGAGQTNALEEWEVEVNAAESRLQGYVERLQDKGDKEVARIIKVCCRTPRVATSWCGC
jgi:ATP-dependent RNA helicase DHX29